MSYGRIWDDESGTWKYNFMGVYHSGNLIETDIQANEESPVSIANRTGIKIQKVEDESKVYVVSVTDNNIDIWVLDLDLKAENIEHYTLTTTSARDITTLLWEITEDGIYFTWNQEVWLPGSGYYRQIFTAFTDFTFASLEHEYQRTSVTADGWVLSDMQHVNGTIYASYFVIGKYRLGYGSYDADEVFSTVPLIGPSKFYVDLDAEIISYASSTYITGVLFTGISDLDGSNYNETQRSITNITAWEIVKKDKTVYFATLSGQTTKTIRFGKFNDDYDQTGYEATVIKDDLSISALYISLVIPEDSEMVYITFNEKIGTYVQVHLAYLKLTGTGAIITNITYDETQNLSSLYNAMVYNASPKRAYFYYRKNDGLGDPYPYVGYQDFIYKSQIKYYTGSAWA